MHTCCAHWKIIPAFTCCISLHRIIKNWYSLALWLFKLHALVLHINTYIFADKTSTQFFWLNCLRNRQSKYFAREQITLMKTKAPFKTMGKNIAELCLDYSLARPCKILFHSYCSIAAEDSLRNCCEKRRIECSIMLCLKCRNWSKNYHKHPFVIFENKQGDIHTLKITNSLFAPDI